VRKVALHAFLIPLVLLLLAAGCDRGSVSGAVPVRGKVTYGGQPVAGATVTFISESESRPAVAVTDASGTFQLKTLDSAGALPGMYTVLVTKTDVQRGDDKPISMDEAAKNRGKPTEPKQLLPAKYADPAKTPLKVDVLKGKTNSFDLSLTD
jgi:Carboxypeptidase regulatory-like domain